ncbi:MAG: hypothetical protein ACLT98_09095 [Eggerthellaceae bacterium]
MAAFSTVTLTPRTTAIPVPISSARKSRWRRARWSISLNTSTSACMIHGRPVHEFLSASFSSSGSST